MSNPKTEFLSKAFLMLYILEVLKLNPQSVEIFYVIFYIFITHKIYNETLKYTSTTHKR
jgi:hypothetical protein